jgi:hypothetical protein
MLCIWMVSIFGICFGWVREVGRKLCISSLCIVIPLPVMFARDPAKRRFLATASGLVCSSQVHYGTRWCGVAYPDEATQVYGHDAWCDGSGSVWRRTWHAILEVDATWVLCGMSTFGHRAIWCWCSLMECGPSGRRIVTQESVGCSNWWWTLVWKRLRVWWTWRDTGKVSLGTLGPLLPMVNFGVRDCAGVSSPCTLLACATTYSHTFIPPLPLLSFRLVHFCSISSLCVQPACWLHQNSVSAGRQNFVRMRLAGVWSPSPCGVVPDGALI